VRRAIQLDVLEGGGVFPGFDVSEHRRVWQSLAHVALDALCQVVALLHGPRARHQQVERHERPSSRLARAQRVELDVVLWFSSVQVVLDSYLEII
jgi:hypothetical protein